MAKRLEDSVAIVTGASRGIGRAIALELASHGATIVLAARQMHLLEQVAQQVNQAGGRGVPIVVDLADEESIKSLVTQTQQQCGRLDILINNAGLTHSAPADQTATEDWDRLMTVNARGPFILCRQAIPLLKNAPQGTIVNISSVVGVKGYPLQLAYTASKHALRGMSIVLAEELRQFGIRVHVICPGGVNTDMVSQVRPDIDTSELIAPEEIAELVAYLVTHRGNGVVDEIRIRRATSNPWF